MSNGYDPRHAGDPRHGNRPEPQPDPEDVNAGWVQPQDGLPDPSSMPTAPGWSGTPPQRYAAQPYSQQPYGAQPYQPPSYEPPTYPPSPYAPPTREVSPYAPGSYNPAPNPSPYAPVPSPQRPAAPPYASAAYAPAPYDGASAVAPRRAGRVVEPREKPMLTPFRVVIFIALVVSAAIATYSLFIARGSQVIPVTVAALAVFALSAALLGINIGAGAMGSARDGHLGRSIFGALVGGILCLAAAGGASAAIMLGMLSRA